MTTNADIGYGWTFKKGDGATPTEAFTALTGVEVTSITPPGYTRDALDATHNASPDRFREYIAGLMDAGEVQLEIAYIPSVTDALIAAVLAGKANYQVATPDDTVTFTFSAICTNYQPTAPVDGKMTATATFKVSGKPTLTDES